MGKKFDALTMYIAGKIEIRTLKYLSDGFKRF